MIVGTAGHIDHGKTTLVRALTGVDTDRLPEEKKRGISIELGYAFLDLPGEGARLGFIDVPGHERLVHTMLAGATGIDLALLLVAADDGVMPQTREHLAVLSLLAVPQAALVLTKIDRVDAARLVQVRAEATALLAETPLADAPVFEVAASSGQGVTALRDWLLVQAQALCAPVRDGRAFRLAIDRAFSLDGIGTVVTGTVHAGSVAVGDELALASGAAARARVRSVHAQNRPVTRAVAGERCALGLVGVARDEVARGDWLVEAGVATQSTRIDVDLRVWHAETRALRSGTPVQVHLGAACVRASVAVLDGGSDALAPGQRGRVQLVLRAPMAAWRGDRVVLRDESASRTLGGGRVLDPQAPSRYRRTALRLLELDACALSDAEQRLRRLLEVASRGVDLCQWARAEGRAGAMPELEPGSLLAHEADASWALAPAHRDALQRDTLAALQGFHQRWPDEMGPDAARLRRLAVPRLCDPLWRALLAEMRVCASVAQRGAYVHLPEHGVKLSATEERIAQKVATLLAAGGFGGVWVRDLARDTQEPEILMRTTLARLAQRGELHQVVKDLFYPLSTIGRLAAIARDVAARDGQARAASFRDATGLGRKRAIQILEHFDRIGMTRRSGDAHKLRSDTALFASPGEGVA